MNSSSDIFTNFLAWLGLVDHTMELREFESCKNIDKETQIQVIDWVSMNKNNDLMYFLFLDKWNLWCKIVLRSKGKPNTIIVRKPDYIYISVATLDHQCYYCNVTEWGIRIITWIVTYSEKSVYFKRCVNRDILLASFTRESWLQRPPP